MEQIHRDCLRKNLVMLNNDTVNTNGLVDYLVQRNIIATGSMADEIYQQPTKTAKNRKLYSVITCRGPRAFNGLIDGLKMSGNSHIAQVLLKTLSTGNEAKTYIKSATTINLGNLTAGNIQIGNFSKMIINPQETRSSQMEVPFVETQQPQSCSKNQSYIFDSMIENINSLRPIEYFHQRSTNPTYKVSVNKFNDAKPKSKVMMTELPYVMGLYLGKPLEKVIRWPSCPSKIALGAAYAIYHQELEEVETLLSSLTNSSFDFQTTFRDGDEIVQKIQKILQQPINVYVENYQPTEISVDDKKILLMRLHFTIFGSDYKFMVRKDFKPKPSAYLMFNMTPFSVVIRQTDRHIITKFLNDDESNDGNEIDELDMECPF